MGIFIKNPETERVVRELAALRGDTITGVIDSVAREALDREQATVASPVRGLRNLAQMRASNEHFRRISGLDKRPGRPVTKAEWDALWPTGIPEIDDA
jgi:antitoxin VapB